MAVVAGRTDTFLGERYRRIARRRGAKRAIVAVGRSILVIVWHLLADPTARSPSIFRMSLHVPFLGGRRAGVKMGRVARRRRRVLGRWRPWISLAPDLRAHRLCLDPGCATLRRGAAACLRTVDFGLG